MGKISRKIEKLKKRIAEIEGEMYTQLKQKTSATPEISIHKYQDRLAQMHRELAELEKK